MKVQQYFDGYSPVGDLSVVACCCVIFLLLGASYVKKNRAFLVYLNIILYLLLASITDVLYHTLYTKITDGNYTSVYVLRVLFHIFLFSDLLLLVVYIVTLMHLERKSKFTIMGIATVVYLAIVFTDIVTTMRGTGFRLDNAGQAVSGKNIFLYGYLSFMVIMIFLMIRYRKRVYIRIMMGLAGTFIISLAILFLQGRHGQSSYTVMTFLFPSLSMLYLLHNNPYDANIGSVSPKELEDLVEYSHKHGQKLIYVSLWMPEFEKEGQKFPEEMQETIRRFSTGFFRDGTLFQISNGHVVLFARQSKNPEYEKKEQEMLEAFAVEYDRYGYDYKIVLGTSMDSLDEHNAYVRFIKAIQAKMPINSIHFVEDKDLGAFEEYEYILSELGDIVKKADPEDPRVLVYCQPVYDLKTKTFNTGEVLMRLDLPKMGLVMPYKFISLAEEYGYIHSLTLVMLRKTAKEVAAFLAEGYVVNRISVNVSVMEMRAENFAEEFSSVIRECGLAQERIAIEITESQNEKDFLMLKDRMGELRQKGIKFYLDDFGTGYSNMERILSLPFDIIKFDRSLVIASGENERSEKMVDSLSDMFSDLGYAVLYEGVENESDEGRCTKMYARFLQGYKYSKPIPIREAKTFFSKETA